MIKLNCKECHNDYEVIDSRAEKSKYCSRLCADKSKPSKPNTVCTECGTEFHQKESVKKRYKRTHGYFCSTRCIATFRKKQYLGKNNPNFRNIGHKDGYELAYLPQFGSIKLHHKVVFEYLGLTKLPTGYCVHHRDCNVNNNDESNLAILTHSDHRWLHKNFGNATLWAYYNNLVDLQTLISWSRDEEKSRKLLPLSIINQNYEFKKESKN